MQLRRLVADTLPLQAAGLIVLVTQNLIGPWWFGRTGFGEATRALALPYLLQGLIEPIMISVWLAAASSEESGLSLRRRLLSDSFFVMVAGSLAACVLSLVFNGISVQAAASLIAAVVVFPLLLISTALIADLYARKRFDLLTKALFANCLSFVVALLLARPWGASGFVLAIGVSHVFLQLTQLRPTIEICKEAVQCFVGRGVVLEPRPWRRYVAALAPKASLLWFNAGILFVASVLLLPSDLAHLKVALTMAFAVLHVLPVSAYVLQVHSALSIPADALRRLGSALLFVTVLSVAIAVGLWIVMPWVESGLLGEATARFRSVAWAAPAIALIALLGALLTARSEQRGLVQGAGVGFALSLAVIGCTGAIASALLVGLYSTTTLYAATFLRLAARST